MASNRFGELFTITTWGESHGKAVGVVIDGCPAGLVLDEELIQVELKRRAPGLSALTSPRKEPDEVEILSGLFERKTTGAPISLLIWNKDADSSKYEPIKHLIRPGHANATYLAKYGCYDYRGGGRASARETACRVAAGAIAKQLLNTYQITVRAAVTEVGGHLLHLDLLEDQKKLEALIKEAQEAGDSLGGIVTFWIEGVPVGLGDPIYQKLEAKLASAMMSLPATKGFEIGSGFAAAAMQGSRHNKEIYSGGILGGISSGTPIMGRVAFKPTSSIKQTQETIDIEGNPATFCLPEGSRHDPCIALRTPVIVEAMAALVIADGLLLNRSSQIFFSCDPVMILHS
jgi:chorismate synthase